MEENEVDLTFDDNKENPPEPEKKKRSYKMATKLEVINAAHLSSISEAGRSYGIARQVCTCK